MSETKAIQCTMAKASMEECLAVMRLGQMLEDVFEKGDMPRDVDGNWREGDDDSSFAQDYAEDLERLHEVLKGWMDKHGSAAILRVAMGMGVLVDPKNALLDPAGGHLALHPRFLSGAADGGTEVKVPLPPAEAAKQVESEWFTPGTV